MQLGGFFGLGANSARYAMAVLWLILGDLVPFVVQYEQPSQPSLEEEEEWGKS